MFFFKKPFVLFLDSDITAQTAPSASEGLPSIFSPHFSLAETNNIWSSSVYKVCNHGLSKCDFWLLTWEAVKDMCPLHLFTMSSYTSHQASIYTKSFIFCGMIEHHLHILSVAGWWCHSNILQHHIHSERAQTAIVRHGIFLLCRTQSCEYGSVSFYLLISWMAIKKNIWLFYYLFLFQSFCVLALCPVPELWVLRHVKETAVWVLAPISQDSVS